MRFAGETPMVVTSWTWSTPLRAALVAAVIGPILLPDVARADNCSSLSDCWSTLGGALGAAAGAGAVGGLLGALGGLFGGTGADGSGGGDGEGDGQSAGDDGPFGDDGRPCD